MGSGNRTQIFRIFTTFCWQLSLPDLTGFENLSGLALVNPEM
jgi:hypothetical protein